MPARQPLISVILPVYNGETFLAEALESVFHQSYHSLEIIVVDDGSTDGTASIAAHYGKKIVFRQQQNAGPAAARNKGLNVAKGEFIAFIDADDTWPQGKLALQLDYFRKDPSLEAVIGHTQYLLLTQVANGELAFVSYQQPVLGVNLGAGVYRKKVFQVIGNFEPQLRWSEDVDLFLRLREQRVPMIIIDEVTLNYRIHTSNMTRERDKEQILFLRAIKRSLDRRRAAGQRVAETLPDLDKRPSRGSP